MRRYFNIRPGYDFRKETKGKYGCHGCEFLFGVIGDHGAISLTIYTDWFPQSVQSIIHYEKPWVTDVGYHSRTKTEYGSHMNECHLTEGECWYDGTSLNKEWQHGIIHGGSDWLWEKLEALYKHQFEGADYPDLSVEPQRPPNA